MSKNKPHKGLLKRIRISKTGLVRHKTTGHKHLRSGKGGKRLRQMRKGPFMSNPEAKRHEKLLFRRLRGRDQSRAALKRNPSPAERKAAKAAAAAGTKVAPTAAVKAAASKAAAKAAAPKATAPKAAAPKVAAPKAAAPKAKKA